MSKHMLLHVDEDNVAVDNYSFICPSRICHLELRAVKTICPEANLEVRIRQTYHVSRLSSLINITAQEKFQKFKYGLRTIKELTLFFNKINIQNCKFKTLLGPRRFGPGTSQYKTCCCSQISQQFQTALEVLECLLIFTCEDSGHSTA